MKSNDTVKVLDKALDILECFSMAEQEFTIKELSSHAGLSTSTAFRIIKTLENRQYLYRQENKKYSLGLKLSYLGTLGTSAAWEILKHTALPHMKLLRSLVNESISIYIRDGDKRVCITRLESTNSLRQVIRIGDLYNLTEGATSKILVAYASETVQSSLLGENLTTKKAFLDKIRNDGYAVSHGERAAGVSAIAAPIFNADGSIMASLSLSGPTTRIDDKQLPMKIKAVMDCAASITEDLQNQ